MTQARPRIPAELSGLTRSEWDKLIFEANLGEKDTEVAKRYFIGKECQIDIAIDEDTDRTQISRRIGRVRRRLQDVYNRIPN